jgi:hypothetical protein
MPEPSLVLRDTGQDDLAIANAARRRRGEPESALRWTCQHSCAEASIPDCRDPNCEAALVLDEADARRIRAAAEQGDLAPFGAATLTCRISAPPPLVDTLLAASPEITRGASSAPAAGAVDLRGSLLAFARCCARIAADADAAPDLKALGVELAEKLRAAYWNGARALLDQRFVDRRTQRTREAPLIAFAARGDGPGLAYVAFGVDKGGSTTGYDVAYGLVSAPKQPWRFAQLSPGASREPGELYGPSCRLVVHVDPALQVEARAIAERFAKDTAPGDPSWRCLHCFTAIAQALGLDLPASPASPATENELPTLRPARFVRALMNRIPL